MNRLCSIAAFALGAAAVAWVAWGYAGGSPLALAMTLLIGAVYGVGAFELWRFQQASAGLRAALALVTDPLPGLAGWLARVPPSLRHAVRLRIEGERVGLPGPALTPYLVGLLVLLGMLGTFLGMVVTLNGAVLALETTTDLPTIRAALAAPVKGLGLAFGTSVAGVAASAMLGLVSALCRRERLQAAQLLDGQVATGLRAYSAAHQREATLAALQSQGQAMPALLAQVETLMAQLARQSEGLNQRLLAGQERFHGQAQASYGALAASVDRSLKDSLGESARLAVATVEPVVQATLGSIARESAAFQAGMVLAVQTQLDGLSTRFGQTVDTVSEVWATALARHEQSNAALAGGLQQSLGGFARAVEQGASTLLASVDARQQAGQAEQAVALAVLSQQAQRLHQRMADTAAQQLGQVAERFGVITGEMTERWREALVQQQRNSQTLAAGLQQSQAAAASSFTQGSAALLATVDQAHAALRAGAAAGDQQRLAAWTRSLAEVAESLRQAWQQAGDQALGQQRQICQTLEQTARDLHTRADAQARNTLAELARLIDTAADAPRAAVEVAGLMRQQLSDSLARDNTLLDERSRIMGSLAALLDALNQAATDQRQAIDSVVAASAGQLQQAGARLHQTLDAEAGRLSSLGAQLSCSAVEVASLGEAFGVAVGMFDRSSQALTDQLQRIEGALDKSSARSDEQLGYYVAQAREIIDLSVGAQKQIVDELQALSRRPARLADEVA